ncbi:hypothetical protein ACSSS7_008333 [Eimeria intestinalis]
MRAASSNSNSSNSSSSCSSSSSGIRSNISSSSRSTSNSSSSSSSSHFDLQPSDCELPVLRSAKSLLAERRPHNLDEETAETETAELQRETVETLEEQDFTKKRVDVNVVEK